tara:strand:+ start:391 stop:555 length:165 start_codon:yes stop_codon:yes gene_type:complete
MPRKLAIDWATWMIDPFSMLLFSTREEYTSSVPSFLWITLPMLTNTVGLKLGEK